MHLNGLLDVLIIIVRGGSEAIEFRIEVVEVHLDLGTAAELNSGLIATHLSLGVISSRDRVLISCNEISDHAPEKLSLGNVLVWHGWSQVFEVAICIIHLVLDLFHDFWKTMLDVSEQNLCQLGG